MDDFTAEMIAAGRTPAAEAVEASVRTGYFGGPASKTTSMADDHSVKSRESPPLSPETTSVGTTTTTKHQMTGGGGGLRGKISALKDKANFQDRLVEKLLQHVIPEEDGEDDSNLERENLDATIDVDDVLASRPNFNITTMSNNFRRFNARIGVVFRFQVRMARLMRWKKSSHTLSFLAVYTFVCLDPYLLVLLPLASILLGILIPSFIARHPPLAAQVDHSTHLVQTLQARQLQLQQSNTTANIEYSPRGPPLAPARTVKPVKELSKDFFRNMRDLQNSMDDFSVGHDTIVALLVPATNFSDEALSSAVFLTIVVAFMLLSIAAHLIPWRLAALVAGWAVVCMGHPAAKRMMAGATRAHIQPRAEEAQSALRKFARRDVILDVAPETREVEIFELQRRSSDSGGTEGEWEPWLFTANPYDPLSATRIAGERPKGSRFFEDILPPSGWDWSEKKWALDLWSRDWVEERIITAVEVETEGERWVYDMVSSYDAQGKEGDPVIDHSAENARAPLPPAGGPSWEEGLESDGVGRRGEWRRRRWVRLVKRKIVAINGSNS